MPSSKLSHSQKSAVPTFYYIVFGIIEPLITFASFLEGIFDPVKVIKRHERWPSGFTEATGVPSPTVHAIICQMVVAHAVIGCISFSVLRAVRKLPSPALQEDIARSLLIPLAIGDILHLFGTFYGIGEVRWRTKDWPQVLWLSIFVGIALFVPRVCWLIGVGRYVATRDTRLDDEN